LTKLTISRGKLPIYSTFQYKFIGPDLIRVIFVRQKHEESLHYVNGVRLNVEEKIQSHVCYLLRVPRLFIYLYLKSLH